MRTLTFFSLTALLLLPVGVFACVDDAAATAPDGDAGAAGDSASDGMQAGGDGGGSDGTTASPPASPSGVVAGAVPIVTTVSTLAGSGTGTFKDDTGVLASFNSLRGLAADATGNLYVADVANHRIRKVTPAGVVTTLAGSGTEAFADGTGGPTGTAAFDSPSGVAVDAAGNVYVADALNYRIRKVSPTGDVTTLAGHAGPGANVDGTGAGAGFNIPVGVAVDATNNIYVADQYNDNIRKVTPAGVVTTIAGSGAAAFADGNNASASFNLPR
ncbi:MAG: gluconolaconase, partial [Polyangiaceae bacterium]